jgi:hypothetical protein
LLRSNFPLKYDQNPPNSQETEHKKREEQEKLLKKRKKKEEEKEKLKESLQIKRKSIFWEEKTLQLQKYPF